MRGVTRPIAVLTVALVVGTALSGVAGAVAVDTPSDNASEAATPTSGATGLLDPADPVTDAAGERVASPVAGPTASAGDDATTDARETSTASGGDSGDMSGDVVAGATNATTGTVNATTNATTGTVDATTNATSDSVNATTNATSEPVNATTGAVDATVNATTDRVAGTVNGTTETVDTVASETAGESVLTNVTERTTSSVDSTTSTVLDGTEDLTDTATDGVAAATDPTRTDAERLPVAPPGAETEPTTANLLDGEAGHTVPAPVDAVTPTSESADPQDRPSVADGAPVGTAAAVPDGQGEPTPTSFGGSALAGFGAVAVGAALAGSTGVEREVAERIFVALERLVRLVAPFRYSQFDDSDPLEHEDRAAIHEYVTENPGAYLAAVSEQVGVNHSTARHHVKMLEREGLVEDAKVRGRRRLFPAHAQQQELAAAMTDEATAAILEALARLGPCSGSTLADEVDRAVSTVSHHLSRLADDGLVDREKDGRTRINSLPSDVQAALAPEREPAAVDPPTISAD